MPLQLKHAIGAVIPLGSNRKGETATVGDKVYHTMGCVQFWITVDLQAVNIPTGGPFAGNRL